MLITAKQVNQVFASCSHQMEVVEALYRLVFPDYDDIMKIDGFPGAGEKLSKLIWQSFFEFDREHHPEVMAGGRWINSGFSTNKELCEWEVDATGVKKIMKEAQDGRNDNASRRTDSFEARA